MSRSFGNSFGNQLRHATSLITNALPQPFSMLIRLRPDSTGRQALFSNNNDTGPALFIEFNTETAIRVFMEGSDRLVSASQAFDLGEWHTIGVSYHTDDSIEIYFQGSNIASGSFTKTGATEATGAIIGGLSFTGISGFDVDGEVADFAFYNEALVDEEQFAFADGFSPKLIRPGGLVSHVPIIGTENSEIDEISGDTWEVIGTLTKSDHPPVFMPSPALIGITAAAANTLVLNNVQTGTIAFGAANTSRNVTITSVDTAKCFILIDWQTDSAGSVATTQHYRARLSSSTNIAIDRTAAVSGDDGLVRWWAVEFSAGITVRHFTGTSRNTNVAIGATVDLAKTFAIISDRPQTFDYDDSQIEGVDIVSTTNFQVKTDNTAGSAPNWAVQIVEFDALADPVVEAVTITMSGGTTTNTGSISAITVADSMLIGSGTWSETLGVASQMGFSAALDDTTTVSVTRVTGTGTLIAYMFVVDWGSSIDIRTGVDTLTTAEGVSETQTFSALGSTGDAIAFMRGGSGTFGAQSNHSGSPDDADYAEVSLDSTTQITITRSGTSNDLGPYNWQVIDFAGFAAEDVLMPQVWM